MDGFIDSFKGSLQTLIGWPKRSGAGSSAVALETASLQSPLKVQPSSDGSTLQPSVANRAEDVDVRLAARADGDEAMSTAAVVQAPVAPAKTRYSILDHLKLFFGIALRDVEEYEPEAETLAKAIFPQYATAIDVEQKLLVGMATTIKNTVLTMQQKYSQATAGDITNEAKLRDALDVLVPLVQPTLQSFKVPIPATVTDIANKIEATVAILKNYTVPVATPSASGTVKTA